MPAVWLLLALGQILTVLMIIDCIVRRNDLRWLCVLIFLGPVGGGVYLWYHRDTGLLRFAGLGHAVDGPCPRCGRSVYRLERYDGDAVVCAGCVAELDTERFGAPRYRGRFNG